MFIIKIRIINFIDIFLDILFIFTKAPISCKEPVKFMWIVPDILKIVFMVGKGMLNLLIS